MKRALRRAVVALAAGASCALAAATAFAFEVPRPVVRTLPHGLRVAVFSDTSLPVVQMQLLVRVGSSQDPAGKEGLANLLALMLNQGTAKRAAERFAAELDQIGATFSSAATRDFTTAGCSALSREFPAALDLLADAVVAPALGAAELGRQRVQLIRAMDEGRFNPPLVVDAHLWAMTMPPHPYAHPVTGTPESVSRISSEDLVAQHRAFFRPDNATLAIAGDVDVEAAFQAAAATFAGWEADSTPRLPAPPPAPLETVVIRIVDSPGAQRALLRLGQPWPARDQEDYLAVLVMNSVLSGGGLAAAGRAAGADSAATPPDARPSFAHMKDAGLFTLGASCEPEEAGRALRALREALRRFAARTPAPAEVERAVRSIGQGFPLQLETRGNWASQWLTADFYGLPPDYFQTFRQRVRVVTAADVQRAARRHLDPDHIAVVALGPGEALRQALQGSGRVHLVDLLAAAGPAPQLGEEGAGPSPEQQARARDRVSRAIAAHGGEKALRSVRASETWGRIVFTGPGSGLPGRFHQVRQDPFRMWVDLDFTSLGSVRSVQGLDGRKGWVNRPGIETVTADSSTVAAMRSGFLNDPAHLLLLAADPSSRVSLLGREDFHGSPADALSVMSAEGQRRRLYFDPQTSMLIGLELEDMFPSGRATLTRRFREYRDVDGVKWPFFEQQYTNGALARTFTLSDAKLNPVIPDTLFAPPTPPKN